MSYQSSDWDQIRDAAKLYPQEEEIIIMPPPPIKTEDPGDYDPRDPKSGVFRSYSYYGTVVDSASQEPIAGATVAFYAGGQLIHQVSADSKGVFQATFNDAPVEVIRITSAEHKGWDFPASTVQHILELERKVKELPPVLLDSGGKKNTWLWLLLAGAVIVDQSGKKKVGKVDVGTILTIGAGAALLYGLKATTAIFQELGITQSQAGKDYDWHLANPNSFWNGNFWQKGPPGTLLITHAGCQWLYDEIYNSFGFFDDDEERIYAAFKSKVKTKSQLSYFSYWLQLNKGKDLLRWLHGGNYGPIADHLSVKEISVITKYVEKLPDYKL